MCFLATTLCRGTGMVASSSTFRLHIGNLIGEVFRLLHAVKHGTIITSGLSVVCPASFTRQRVNAALASVPRQ